MSQYDDRFGLINHPYLHYGVITITQAFAAGVDSGACVILCNGGALAVTLPLAADVPGKAFYIKKIDVAAGAITITRTGANTIEGVAANNNTAVVNQFDGVLVVSDGVSGWWFLVDIP